MKRSNVRAARTLALPAEAPLIVNGWTLFFHPLFLGKVDVLTTEVERRKVIGRQVGFAYVGGAVVPASMGLLAASLGLAAIMPAVLVAVLTLLVLSEVLNAIT